MMMMMITSQSNARVKQIRGLHNRREREQTGLFFIEGIRIVAEAVQSAAQWRHLWLRPLS